MQNDIVPFYGQNLMTAKDERDGKEFVAMKPLCDNLGLEWEPQRKRIQRDEVLSSTTSMMEVVARDGKNREMIFLPIEYLNGWLFGVDISRLKDQATRERMIVYKKECYSALHKHWNHRDNGFEMKKRIEILEKGQAQLSEGMLTLGKAFGELSENLSKVLAELPSKNNFVVRNMFVTQNPSLNDDENKKVKFIAKVKEVIEANDYISQTALLETAGYNSGTVYRRWLHDGIGEYWGMRVMPGTKYIYFSIDE